MKDVKYTPNPKIVEAHKTHGMWYSKEYGVWDAMIQRCTNSKNKSFYNYGGRGINVSSSWRKFANFYEDMGDRPSPRHTLERLDNDLGYSRENCEWKTRDYQMHNRRTYSSTGYKGVYKIGKKYRSEIQKNGKRQHLGYFLTPQEASIAYANASKALYE